jgi:hypothetical protein
MRATMFARMAVCLLLAGSMASVIPQSKTPEPMKLKVGDTAPDFTLLAYDGKGVKPIALRDFRGKKNVALAFYVFAFTGG